MPMRTTPPRPCACAAGDQENANRSKLKSISFIALDVQRVLDDTILLSFRMVPHASHIISSPAKSSAPYGPGKRGTRQGMPRNTACVLTDNAGQSCSPQVGALD